MSGGGGGGPEGAPDYYYRHLARTGEQEMDMARKLMDFAGYDRASGGPTYADMEQAQIGANLELIPEQTALQKEQIGQARQVTRQRAPVLRQYFQEAQSVDPETRANRAQAEVAQGYGQARDQAVRNITRTGAAPGSGRVAAITSDLASEQARSTAAAKSLARRDAEKERFSRLSQAVGVS